MNRLHTLFIITLALTLALGSTAFASELTPAPESPISRTPAAAARPCQPGPNVLCVRNNRFRVTATFHTPNGATASAHAVSLTGDTGYFWFFDRSNVEFLLKIVDGCALATRRYWVFAGGLTNLRVDITVEDTTAGTTKAYRNPQNTAFRPIQDTDAFGGCPRGAGSESPVKTATSTDLSSQIAAVGTSAAPTLDLKQGRFSVSATWRTPSGQTGAAQPVRLTDETGYFWFFDSNNVEVFLKILDGCSLTNRFWVFAGGLTNVAVAIHIEDRATGVMRTYFNPPNSAFSPIQDTSAFGTCTTAGLPPDPGEAGRRTLAGIDSDRDGIRDDLQRYVALTYGDYAGLDTGTGIV